MSNEVGCRIIQDDAGMAGFPPLLEDCGGVLSPLSVHQLVLQKYCAIFWNQKSKVHLDLLTVEITKEVTRKERRAAGWSL